MGLRLNIATKYDVRYKGASISFNWMCEDFLTALSGMGVPYTSSNDEDPCADFEIDVDEIKFFLKQHRDEDEQFRKKVIITSTNHGSYTDEISVQDLYDVLSNALIDADTHTGSIHFAWF